MKKWVLRGRGGGGGNGIGVVWGEGGKGGEKKGSGVEVGGELGGQVRGEAGEEGKDAREKGVEKGGGERGRWWGERECKGGRGGKNDCVEGVVRRWEGELTSRREGKKDGGMVLGGGKEVWERGSGGGEGGMRGRT